jgi:hypothetical protein
MEKEIMSRTYSRRIGFVGLPLSSFGLAALGTAGTVVFAMSRGWPLWGTGVAAVVPWVPLFVLDVAWTIKRYKWLALFYVLVVTQVAHFGEHVAQMVQIHALGLEGLDARGIIGALDIEWVHFAWNAWVLIAVLVLLTKYSSNPCLWLTGALAAWHAAEHLYILTLYTQSGVAGAPGLLAQGGALGGGLPIVRPDLHFVYNALETAPLVVAFVRQIQQAQKRPPRRLRAD